MNEKKDGTNKIELIKSASRPENLKKSFLNLKNGKVKAGMKKVGRSRNQKGHKNY